MKFGKWIGGGIGWALGGPLGGILGYFIGAAFDTKEQVGGQAGYSTGFGGQQPGGAAYSRQQTSRGDFMVSLVVLTAAVMKADGKVTQAELNYVKQFFVRQFGVDAATDGIRMLRDVLKQQIPVYDVSRQIGQMLNYSSRLQLIDYLFGISNADGSVQANESNVIEVIARNMGISDTDFNSIKSMFVKQDADSAYKILGISPSATDDEVKKAYRKMAVENHPDKVAYLGEDVQRAAKEKFQKINEAYEAIKKQRGFS